MAQYILLPYSYYIQSMVSNKENNKAPQIHAAPFDQYAIGFSSAGPKAKNAALYKEPRTPLFHRRLKYQDLQSVDSLKFDSIRLTRAPIASSSSGPSAVSTIEVLLVIPRDNTPSKLLAFTRLSPFSIKNHAFELICFLDKKSCRSCIKAHLILYCNFFRIHIIIVLKNDFTCAYRIPTNNSLSQYFFTCSRNSYAKQEAIVHIIVFITNLLEFPRSLIDKTTGSG